ncbi:MAG: hypothetical protein J7L11_08010 [Thermoprotei archaeon]|nr:hypothetical protein [Thermoprotei archaeon]
MNVKGLSSYELVLELEGGESVPIILERYRAPLVIERLVSLLPLRARLFRSSKGDYVYIPLNFPQKIGLSGRDTRLSKGDVAFMAFNQSLFICLRDVIPSYPSMIIGRVKDLSSLGVFADIRESISVVMRSHEA